MGFFIILVNHVLACVWYKIGEENVPGYGSWLEHNDMLDKSTAYQYFTALHFSLTQFTPASMDVHPRNLSERMFSVVVLIFALCIFSSFVSSITAAMTYLRNLTAQQD